MMSIAAQTPPIDEAHGRAKPRVVLELKDATFHGRSKNSLILRRVNLTVRQGDLVMIHVDRAQDTREFSSMLQGLQPLSEGEIHFDGQTWKGNDHDRHFKMRSRIGRVFDGDAWVDNLNVIENIMLAPSHHRIDPKALSQSIEFWSQLLDSPELTRDRPSFVDQTTLQRMQWLRAFIGDRTLLLLERPMKSLASAHLSNLVEAVNRIREQAAVIWFAGTAIEAVADVSDPTFHYQLRDGKLTRYRPVRPPVSQKNQPVDLDSDVPESDERSSTDDRERET